MTDRIEHLRGQLQQLEATHQAGQIDAATYATQRTALERELLDLVIKAPTAAPSEPAASPSSNTAAPPAPPPKPPTASAPSDTTRVPTRLSATLAAIVVVLAAAGYAWTGAPSLVAGAPAAEAAPSNPHAESDAEQFAAAVEQLAAKLKENPDNAEGWAMLGRSYMQLGRFTEALPALAKATALQGDDPQILADYADAIAVVNNRNLEGEPTKLIERALKLDPRYPKALALAGTAAFNRKDYAAAVRHWETLAQVAPPDSPYMDRLRESIAQARQLAGLPHDNKVPAAPGPRMADASPPAAPPSPHTSAQAAAATNVTLRGTVKLAPALAKTADPQDTVFIYARAVDGPRMPLAIVRKQVRDLPFEFTLDDNTAMTPAMKLSLFSQVVVEARISKTGQAQVTAGDLTGRSAPVAHNASGVVVQIADVVKQ